MEALSEFNGRLDRLNKTIHALENTLAAVLRPIPTSGTSGDQARLSERERATPAKVAEILGIVDNLGENLDERILHLHQIIERLVV